MALALQSQVLLNHLSVRSSGLAGVVGYDPKVVSTSQGPITLRSHLVPGVLNRLLHSGADRARVEALAIALATETSLEENIYRLCNSNPAQCSIEGLEKAVTFYRAYPSWWEQTVESRFEAQAEGLRAQIHDNFVPQRRTSLDESSRSVKQSGWAKQHPKVECGMAERFR